MSRDFLHIFAMVSGREVRRLRERCIQFFNSLLASKARGILLAADENVVRNATEKIVPLASRDDSTETIFQVVPASGFQTDSVSIEPRTPEHASQIVYVAIEGTTCIIAAGHVDDALD